MVLSIATREAQILRLAFLAGEKGKSQGQQPFKLSGDIAGPNGWAQTKDSLLIALLWHTGLGQN